MQADVLEQDSVQIGKVVFSVKHRTLKGENEVSINPKASRILCMLIQTGKNKTLDRQTIIDTLWQGNYLVGERGLNNSVSELRRAFKACDKDTDYIRTIPREGYQLSHQAVIVSQTLSQTASLTKKPWSYKPAGALIFTLLTTLAVLLSIFVSDPSETKVSANVQVQRQQLTGNRGDERAASINLDADKIAYSWTQYDSKTRIFWHSLKEGKPHQLSDGSLAFDKETFPAWSPDSSQIAFYRYLEQNDKCVVILHDIATRHEQTLGQCSLTLFQGLSWSRDGKHLAYVGKNAEGQNTIFSFNFDTQSTVELLPKTFAHKHYSSLAWSPDSDLLAFRTGSAGTQEALHFVSLDKKIISSAGYEDASINGISWQDDGKGLFVGLTENLKAFLTYAEFNNKPIQRADLKDLTSVSPKNTAFPLVYKDRIGYYIINYVLSVAAINIDAPSLTLSEMVFGADTASRMTSDNQGNKLYVEEDLSKARLILLDTKGTAKELKDLDSDDFYLFHPALSPDGQWITISGNAADKTMTDVNNQAGKVILYNIREKTIISIIEGLPYPPIVTWSEDSQMVTFPCDQRMNSICRYWIQKRQMITQSTQDTLVKVYPFKNNDVLYSTIKGEIKSFSNDTTIISDLSPEFTSSWTFIDNIIYYPKKFSSYSALMALDMSNLNSQILVKFPVPAFFGRMGINRSIKRRQLYLNYRSKIEGNYYSEPIENLLPED